MKLTGKSRMTLYRRMNSGALAYGVDVDERRYIDTAELIRVFGEISLEVTQEENSHTTRNVTYSDFLMEQVLEEVRLLREENGLLREESRLQREQLEKIQQQLANRPLLEDKTEVYQVNQVKPESAVPPPSHSPSSHSPQSTEDQNNHHRHAFSSIMDKLREGVGSGDGGDDGG